MSDVDEAREEDDCEGSAVVFNKLADVSVEEFAFADDAAEVGAGRDEERDHDAEVGGCWGLVPLASKDLDAFLEVDERNIEAERITAKSRNVCEGVAGVGDGKDPVHYQRPDSDPGHEDKEVVPLRCDDVVDGVREDGNGTGDADDAEWLACEEREDAASKDGGEEDFVDAVGVVGFGEHVEGEGEGRQDTEELVSISCCKLDVGGREGARLRQ